MSADPCDCHPRRTNPCPERPSVICDPAYFQMVAVPRLKLLGVPVGAQCQSFLQAKRGFVFDDGTGMGQFVSEQPSLTLPIINQLTGQNYSSPPGFPFIVVGTGNAPHLWNFVRGETGVASSLGWDGTQWVLTAAGGADAQTAVCSAMNAASVGLFGCVVSGDGFVLKKLNAIDAHVIVGAIDGSGNQSFHSLTDAEHLTHPLGKFTTLRWNKVQALNDDGTDTAGGLPALAPFGVSAVTDARICFYSPTTKKVYVAPTGYVNTRTDFENASLSSDTFADEFTFSSITLNYQTLFVSVTMQTGAAKKLVVDILLDGVSQFTLANSDGSSAVSNTVTGGGYVKNITPGVHTVTLRLKSIGAGATVQSGIASLATSNMP